jgi:hypothetical protein
MASPIDRGLPFFHGHYDCSGARNFPVLEFSLGKEGLFQLVRTAASSTAKEVYRELKGSSGRLK